MGGGPDLGDICHSAGLLQWGNTAVGLEDNQNVDATYHMMGLIICYYYFILLIVLYHYWWLIMKFIIEYYNLWTTQDKLGINLSGNNQHV